MKDNTLDAMRAETTQLALLHINKNRDLYALYVSLRESRYNLKRNVTESMKIAEAWSKNNNDEFGALFVAELPLVKWNTVLKEL